MPSDAELTAYAKTIPPIYREIMAAFPKVEPGRKAGNGLAFQTLAIHFANTGRDGDFEDVQEACQQLAEGGFVDIQNEIFAHPTPLGEHLIAVLTSSPRAPSSKVPRLPALTW